MDRDGLASAINELMEMTEVPLETIAKARNAVLERRIAAILILVGGSALPISATVVELIMTLTEEGWENSPDDAAGWQSHIGQRVAERIESQSSQPPRTMAEAMAEKLIQSARGREINANENFHLVLRVTTSQTLAWWIDEIRERLNLTN